jgi:spore coat polysaccharide biosynthesis predicted glycosyltransferase SpsG
MIAVIADGGAKVGLGHVARCSAIVVALRTRGVTVSAFAYGADAPLVVDGVAWAPLHGEPDARVVLLDTYTMPWEERRALAAGRALAVIHVEGEIPAEARLVIAVGGAGGPGVLAGLRYAPLRPPYWGVPARRVRERIERVLVTTGGGALQDAAVELATGLRDALPGAVVALVRGPYARFDAPAGVELVDAPPSLLEPLLAADVVVTAAGQTALEAAATGAATIALPLAANQRANADPLAAAGAAVIVEPGEDVAAAVLGADRAALARAGQAAVDGFGALRIAFRLAQL